MPATTPAAILIVDDDRTICLSLELLLRRAGYVVQSVHRPDMALPAIDAFRPDLVLLDMNFTVSTTGRAGMKLLGEILAVHPRMPVIQMTGWATVYLAVEGMKAGARDFIAKPWDSKELLNAIKTLLAARPAAPSVTAPADDAPFGRIIGTSQALRTVLQQAARVAPTQASVLITGESGTGKELIAEAIHAASKRAGAPFVPVNLGGVPESLFESELFGHKAGAFTDAKSDRKGRFETAEGGTLFLDEIGDLAPPAQVKLLRVLQERQYTRLGESRARPTDVRILSATSRQLSSMVAAGTFREDLLYRINLIHLHLPPLRERPADIEPLARHFLDSARRRYERPRLELSKAAVQWLRKQAFPGNIRQLQNLIERTAILVPEGDARIEPSILEMQATPQPRSNFAPTGLTLEQMEIRMIRTALARNGDEISATARELGLTRAALYRRIEKHNLGE